MVNGLSETTASVNFVDYGYSMTLPMENLRPITPALLTLPFQAVRCCLAGTRVKMCSCGQCRRVLNSYSTHWFQRAFTYSVCGKNECSVLCKQFICVSCFPRWRSACLGAGVDPRGPEWSNEDKRWFQSQVDGELLTARVLSVTERGYEVKLEIRERDLAAALIAQQLAKAPGASPETSCVNSEPNHHEKMCERQLNQEQVQVPGQLGSISKEKPTEGPAAQAHMQLESRCSAY